MKLKLFLTWSAAIIHIVLIIDTKQGEEQKLDQLTEKLFPVALKTVHGTKWGYINRAGRTRISTIYNKAFPFQSNGLAIIELDGKQGLINSHGRYITKPTYLRIKSFTNDRAVVRTVNGYSLIDKTGKVLTKRKYNYIAQMTNNRALFQENEVYGYLDERGEEVIPASYLEANDFESNYTTVKTRNSQYVLIDLFGKTAQTYPYNEVGALSEGRISFKSDIDQKWGFLSETGKQVVEPTFDHVFPYYEGVAIVSLKNKESYLYGLINKKGEQLITPIHEEIILLGAERLALGKTNNLGDYTYVKYALATVDGERLTEFLFTYVGSFRKNVASVSDGKQTQLIDCNGKRKGPSFVGTGLIENVDGLYCNHLDNRFFYSTDTGKTIWKNDQSIDLRNPYSITEKPEKSSANCLVYYPRVEGISNKKEQAFLNNWLKEQALREVKEKEKLSGYHYNGDYEILFFKKHLLVLQLTGKEFFENEAKMLSKQFNAVIDLRDGHIYGLKDLFKQNQTYTVVLNKIIREQLKQSSLNHILKTYSGVKENQSFYIDAETLYVVFETKKSERGFYVVEILLAKIDSIINKNGRMWDSFRRTLQE